MKPLYFALSYILISSLSWAGTVTGQIQLSNGQALNNGTFSFTLSQAAIASGSASVATQSINCYTSNLGQVVGLPDPLVLPIVATNLSSGSLPAGTYYLKLTYYMASGETLTSPELAVALSGSGSMIVSPPVIQPAAAAGYRVYISTTSQAETLQNSVVGFGSYTQSAALISGASLPTQNTVPCSLRFNDELIPSSTNYSVNLVNKNGSQVAGYPQRWFLAGGTAGTINVSQGTPLAIGQVIYPNAIVSNPVLNAEQSVNSPLNLNGYGIKAGLAQLFNPLTSSQQYQVRFGIDSSDSGGYLFSTGANSADISAGAAFDGTNLNWIAKNANAESIALSSAGFTVNADSGLTIGSSFTPTNRFRVASQGNPALLMPSFPQGYSDWTNSGACTNLSTANHGILCYDKNANAFKFSANGGAFSVVNGGGQGFYNTLQQAGAGLVQEPTLNFIGGAVACVDNAGATRTDCPILNTSSTIGSGALFTLTVNTGEAGAGGTNPSIQFGGGGLFNLIAGTAGSGVGDQVGVLGGPGSGAQAGGQAALQGGNGGAGGGAPGVINITAGNPTAANVGGASVFITATDAVGGNAAGGVIALAPGAKQGSGSNGFVDIIGRAADPSTAVASHGEIAFNTTTERVKLNENNDARGYFNVSGQAAYFAWCSGTATAGVGTGVVLFNAGALLSTCTDVSAVANDTTSNLTIPMASPGILRNLRVKAGTAGVNGSSGLFTLYSNGAATSLTCTVGTGTTCSDTTHTATVAAGDLVAIRFTTQGGETLANVRASYEKN